MQAIEEKQHAKRQETLYTFKEATCFLGLNASGETSPIDQLATDKTLSHDFKLGTTELTEAGEDDNSGLESR